MADDERLERLIAANEAAANAINRLVQLLERKESRRRTRNTTVRKAPRPITISPEVAAVADRALARLKREL